MIRDLVDELSYHPRKLLALAIGLVASGAWYVTGDVALGVVGFIFTPLAIGQLIGYWGVTGRRSATSD